MDTSETYKKSIVSPVEPLQKVKTLKWYEDPVYIKMCDCPEIQEKKPEFYHDPCYLEATFNKPIYVITKEEYAYVSDDIGTRQIWLPRQDQLQEMVAGEPYETMLHGGISIQEKSDFISNLPGILFFAYDWEFSESSLLLTYKQPFQSMEQLWLAFVMKEKHGKVWDGEGWIKEEIHGHF